jgi:hypothetical protein
MRTSAVLRRMLNNLLWLYFSSFRDVTFHMFHSQRRWTEKTSCRMCFVLYICVTVGIKVFVRTCDHVKAEVKAMAKVSGKDYWIASSFVIVRSVQWVLLLWESFEMRDSFVGHLRGCFNAWVIYHWLQDWYDEFRIVWKEANITSMQTF